MSQKIIKIALVAFSLSAARQVPVNNSTELMQAMQLAIAGDTIVVAPGTYVGSTTQSGDPGNLPNGRGYFWIGNNGTSTHPIVVVGRDPQNPPILQGSSLSTGYVVHVTGDYVVLKNITMTQADKGVVFDNASHGILEDCTIYNSGAELVHVRDGSSYVKLNRNRLYSSGNSGNGSIGEGFYIGTDQARWGSDDFPQTAWGASAISEGYGGYDWRVDSTVVQCNFVSGGISAECMDIKEGTRFTTVIRNVFVGDSIGLKPGAQSYDDSYIDMKGVRGLFRNNTFYGATNNIGKYIAEVTRSSFAHIPDSLTTDGNSVPWCDTGDADNNICLSTENQVVTQMPQDPRANCIEFFDMDYSSLEGQTPVLNSGARATPTTPNYHWDLLGRNRL